MKFYKIVPTTLGICALMAAESASAALFPDFQVAGTRGIFTADKITGNYDEIIDFNPDSPPNSGTFTVSLKWQAGQFVRDDGTNPLSAAMTGLGIDYGLYALFLGNGTYTTNNMQVTTFNVSPGGILNVFFDSGLDTTLNPTTSTTFYSGTDLNDILVVDGGIAVAGTGTLDPNLPTCNAGINCGSFGQNSTWPLTLYGENFFIDPKPFYNISFQSGQLNNFTVGGITQHTNGSLDIVFNAVPEPGTTALMGISLLGLCFFGRRKFGYNQPH